MNDTNIAAIPKIGEIAKIRLPGETPWAICVEERENSWMGCIVNKLFREYSKIEQAKFTGKNFGEYTPLPEKHKYKKFDVVEFVNKPMDIDGVNYDSWEPV